MATLTASGKPAWLVEITELDRRVSVALRSANLKHVTGACLNDRYCDNRPGVFVQLRHPDFTAEYPLHRISLVVVARQELGNQSQLT